MPVEPRDVALAEISRLRRADVPAASRSRRTSRFETEVDADAARRTSTPTRSGCSRSSRTCSPTRSSSPTRGSVTLRIAPAEAGHALRRTRRCAKRGASSRFSVTDTGIGIAARQAAADLRGVPAGRRHHQPQVRRHRPRPLDQPRDRAPARRRDPRRERRSARAARSRSTCPSATSDRRPTRRCAAVSALGAARRRPSPSVVGAPTPRRARSDRDAADRRRSRRHRGGRPRAARHRGRRDVRAHHGADGAREGLQGRSSRPAATPASPWRTSISRTPSRSTSSCPVWTAGRCSIASSAARRTRHIPCTSSRSTR